MTDPTPLPEPDHDPDVQAARQAQSAFDENLTSIRQDPHLSDLQRAEQIAAIYDGYTDALRVSWESLQGRRRERLTFLESMVPSRPGIPDSASPADRAVLIGAFRSAYGTARATDQAGRAQLLRDAERFDDDAGRRGTLAAITELGELDTLRQWAHDHGPGGTLVDEAVELAAAVNGTSTRTHDRIARQAHTSKRRPLEANNLATLRGEASTQKVVRSGFRDR